MVHGKYKGVGKGYTHNWRYRGHWRETKTAPGRWRIRFKATKGRSGAGKGGPKKGFRIRWKINAYQTAIKTGKGTYQTDMKGTKTLVSSGYKKRKRY